MNKNDAFLRLCDVTIDELIEALNFTPPFFCDHSAFMYFVEFLDGICVKCFCNMFFTKLGIAPIPSDAEHFLLQHRYQICEQLKKY